VLLLLSPALEVGAGAGTGSIVASTASLSRYSSNRLTMAWKRSKCDSSFALFLEAFALHFDLLDSRFGCLDVDNAQQATSGRNAHSLHQRHCKPRKDTFVAICRRFQVDNNLISSMESRGYALSPTPSRSACTPSRACCCRRGRFTL
jgi:hypothetical protein